jgi:hypothetical protein
MDAERGTFEAQLLAHAERQTKALESLNSYFMRLLAVLALLAVIAVVAWLSS